MTTEDSLKQSMDQAKKRYSSLFKLPSDRKVLLLLASVCIASGLLSAVLLTSSSASLTFCLLLGLSVFLMGVFADYITYKLILTKDTIYNLRRTMALSLFSWVLWLLFILLGSTLTLLFGGQNWWLRLFLLGFSSVTILRLVVFFSTSSLLNGRILAASFLEPFMCVVPFVAFWFINAFTFTIYVPLFFILTVGVGIASTLIFLHPLDRIGERTLGMHSLLLFKAFMLNWVLNLNAPFEKLLEELGEKRSVETSLIRFASSGSKAVIAIPSVHPGPFKNIGSSLLPSLLKAALDKELNCTSCVPHGLLGHEYDLASQHENEKIISHVLVTVREMEASEVAASSFLKVTNGLATACCQVFGRCAIVSLTLAPRTIEDLPKEVGLFVREEAERNGLTFCAVVNAHNSIDGEAEMQESIESLKDVVRECLKKAVALKQLPFEVGSSTILPEEFSLEDGMGSGGIAVIIVKSGEQKAGYVVVDGNNMVSGLREDVLAVLKESGLDEGEVFTTDTHSVSALILGDQGYHPVGEAIDRDKLLEYVKKAVLAAIARLEPARASCQNITVDDVTVLGEDQLEKLCLLVDRGLRTAKRTAVPVFLVAGLVLMSFLLLL